MCKLHYLRRRRKLFSFKKIQNHAWNSVSELLATDKIFWNLCDNVAETEKVICNLHSVCLTRMLRRACALVFVLCFIGHVL